jgi:hypothetical protein
MVRIAFMSGKSATNRRRLLLTVSLIALVISLTPRANSLYDLTGEEEPAAQLRGVIQWLNTAIRPQPDLAPASIDDHANVSPFGINTFLQQEAEIIVRERSLELIHDAGFRFIRQEFAWEDIEIHGKDDFVDRRNLEEIKDAWAKYDNIVDLAGRYEIEIIARLGNPPAWTRALTNTIGTNAPPDDFNDFGDFVAKVADRYRGRIRYLQVWNEPNGNEEWGKQDADPEAYVTLLCMAYDRIKKANPDAVVLAGALTPTVAMDGQNMNDIIYLQRMYNAGAGNCFDVFSAQGYGLWSGPSDQRLRPTVLNYPHHLMIRDIMVRNDDADKPIWISEMGWNAVPEGLPAPFGRVTEERQANYAVEAYLRAQAEWPWLGVVNYWFFKRPSEVEEGQPWYYFRMFEPDFTPLPVYSAVADFATDQEFVEPIPEWTFQWNRARPWLFAISSAMLFFSLLQLLTPHVHETEGSA